MRSYAKRYGRQSYMVCALRHEVHDDFIVWLSLYRSDPDAHFGEAERRLYRDVIGHLHEAQMINRRLQWARATQADDGDICAIADPWGYLHSPPQAIDELVRAEWSPIANGRLPPALMAALAASSDCQYRGRSVCVRGRRVGELLFLTFRSRHSLDGLSDRERQVANAVARGQSAKEAGRSLALAPTTVRVHLKHIYDKLGVHSQAELAYLVGRSQLDR
jgi:DNA-binding CsgD family transcriptional regulator